MKKIVLLAMFLSSICFTAESALPNLSNSASSVVKYDTPTATNSSETVVSDSTEKDVTTSTKDDASNNSGLANLPDGKAYIGVTTYLSLRDEPFGTVLDRLYNNEEVIIVDRDGDWYEIESSKGTGWVYGKCVFDSPNSKSPSASYSGSINVNEENNSDKDNAVASKDTTTSKSTSTSTILLQIREIILYIL